MEQNGAISVILLIWTEIEEVNGAIFGKSLLFARYMEE
jgi:hypothetical protein